MSVFQVRDETYGRAGAVIRVAAGLPGSDVPPEDLGYAYMAAGVAMAFERAQPNALTDAYPTSADQWLSEGTRPWRAMHGALARAMEMEASRDGGFVDSVDLMRHVAADVMVQARSQRMHQAVVNTDPAFRGVLKEWELVLVDTAKRVPAEASALREEASGRYSQLPATRRVDLAEALRKGDTVPFGLDEELHRMAEMIDARSEAQVAAGRAISRRQADFEESPSTDPLFVVPTREQSRRAADIAVGAIEPVGPVEQGIAAHAAVAMAEVDHRPGAVLLDARARALAGPVLVEEPAAVAIRIEADVAGMMAARMDHDEAMREPTPLHVAQGFDLRGFGQPAEMGPEAQKEVFRSIESGEGMSPLRELRLAVVAADIADGSRSLQEEQARAIRATGRGIEYERMEAPDRENAYALFEPGDRVRMDPRVDMFGVDRKAIAAKLGDGPLVVARSVVRGETRSDGMGGTREMAVPQYEFLGHAGRYPAGMFQDHRGEDHHYGVVMERGERLFLVPLDAKAEPERPVALGPVVELVGADPRAVDAIVPDAFASFRQEAREQPLAGEYAVRNVKWGAPEKADLVAVPWQSSASPEELAAASRQVDAHLGVAQEGLATRAQRAMAAMMPGSHAR